jgi:RND family efflux transporter MFP subunit
MANKSNLGLKLVLTLAVLAAATVAGLRFLRPTAKVAVVAPGPALNAVPGSVVVQSEGGTRSLTGDVGGRILWSEPLDPGKKFKEGDVLVRLDTSDIELEIENIQIQLDAATKRVAAGSAVKFEYDTALESLKTTQRAHDRGQVSDLDLTQKTRAVQATKQRLDLDEVANQQQKDLLANALKVKQNQHEKMTIKAPFDGQVTAVFAHKGDLINASSPIATLITTTRTVEARISEENFSGIKLGQKASVTFLGGIAGNPPAYIYDGKVSKILPTADPDTQRYIVHLEINVDPENLTPGKTGEVSITVDEHQAKTIVPRRALQGRTLYVVKDDRVEKREVDLGFVWLDGVEITKGVQAGEEVIVDDIDNFREGQSVRAERIQLASSNSK